MLNDAAEAVAGECLIFAQCTLQAIANACPHEQTAELARDALSIIGEARTALEPPHAKDAADV